MVDSPTTIDPAQLVELGIELKEVAEQANYNIV
jgi:hypothetical protein